MAISEFVITDVILRRFSRPACPPRGLGARSGTFPLGALHMQTPIHIDSRFPAMGTTIFTVMSRLAPSAGRSTCRRASPISRPTARCSTPCTATCWPGATSIRRWPACRNCARPSPDKVAALYGTRFDVESGSHRHRRRDAGDLHGHCRLRPSGRRGDRLRAGLRQLRAGHRDGRRHGGLRAAAVSRITRRTGRRCGR
jgi:hypothetical protein